MKPDNRKELRDALLGQQITDVVFHDSHGLVIDIVLEDGHKMSVCTYEGDDAIRSGLFGDFYVSLDGKEL